MNLTQYERPDITRVDLIREKLLLQPNLNGYLRLSNLSYFLTTDKNVASLQLMHQFSCLSSTSIIQPRLVNHFIQSYESSSAITWYTKDCFIYRITNEVLRNTNLELCNSLRQFIADLSKEIQRHKAIQSVRFREQVHITTLYRGLRQNEEELKTIEQLVGQVILTKGFMSTTRSKTIALMYAGASQPQTKHSQALLIELHVDLSHRNVSAADVSHLSQFPQEAEVLFDFGNLFRINSFFYNEQLEVWTCVLTHADEEYMSRSLVSTSTSYTQKSFSIEYNEDYRGFQSLIRRARRSRPPRNNHLWANFPSISWIATTSYEQTNVLQQKALINWQLNSDIHKFNEDCYEIRRRIKRIGLNCTTNDKNIACLLNNYGYTLQYMGQSEKALTNLRQSLRIRESTATSEHFIAQCLRNIGFILTKMERYDEAAQSLHRALSITQNSSMNLGWSTSITLFRMGEHYQNRQNYYESIKYFYESFNTYRHTLEAFLQ